MIYLTENQSKQSFQLHGICGRRDSMDKKRESLPSLLELLPENRSPTLRLKRLIEIKRLIFLSGFEEILRRKFLCSANIDPCEKLSKNMTSKIFKQRASLIN